LHSMSLGTSLLHCQRVSARTSLSLPEELTSEAEERHSCMEMEEHAPKLGYRTHIPWPSDSSFPFSRPLFLGLFTIPDIPDPGLSIPGYSPWLSSRPSVYVTFPWPHLPYAPVSGHVPPCHALRPLGSIPMGSMGLPFPSPYFLIPCRFSNYLGLHRCLTTVLK